MSAPLSHERRLTGSRRGLSSLETVAALAILTVILGSTMPLFVRHLRLLADSRHERIAMEELANRAEVLASLPPEDVAAFVARPPLSDRARRRLPGAVLSARREQLGRVVLALSWDAPGRALRPVALAVWLPSADVAPGREAAR
ncbi:MAG: hypothetical protein ACKO9B_12300 [Planctomycetota bacterium]